MINLEQKSKELKEFVSQFETTNFFGNISLMMQYILSPDKIAPLKGLSSPLRQLYYVAGLNLTSSSVKAKKIQFNDQEWNTIKQLLIDIETGYNQFFYPKSPDEVDEEWKARRLIAMPTFLGYFNVGYLNYEEQVIERVSEYFAPFNIKIKAHFGLTVNEFIEIYNYIDSLPNIFLKEKINYKEGHETWQEFTSRMTANGITPDKWMDHMPENLNNFLELIRDNGKMYRFSHKQLEDKFGSSTTNLFLSALTSSREDNPFLYYTETNLLHIKPLLKVNTNEYQILETKQLIHSIYNLLAAFCINDLQLKDKFYAIRGEKLEEKIEKIFQKFFKNKATVYKSFYTQKGNEQDLLILFNGSAFIIEAKSSKRKEPRRDPDKAYDLILDNFDETIQKGYDQAYRVKEYFLNKEILKIYKDQALTKHIADINTKKIYNVYSIIVTLETFGLIQSDLNQLLEIYEDDTFPWSIGIDDLEVFFLTLTKQKKTLANLVHFLNIRENLHGHLFCSDELEVCAAFLRGMINKQVSEIEKTVFIAPDVTSVFDNYYFRGGIGFDNEKNMEVKTDPKYFLMGVDSVRDSKA